MSSLTLAQASTIIDVALRRGRVMNCAPLVVAVLDAGGHLVAYALGMGLGSRQLAVRASSNPVFFNTLAVASGGRFVPVPGGVLIRDAEGEIIGAVGISGDTSDRDEECAMSGIEAAGLKGDPGAAR